MRGLWKRSAILAAIGFALGVLVGLGFLTAYGIGAFYLENGDGALALYLALSGLIGAVNMGSTTIYDLEHWCLLRCTATHFVISMSTVCSVGFSQGWFSLRDPVTLWILAICVVVYIVIWLIMYLRYNRKIRRINAALKRWKDAQQE